VARFLSATREQLQLAFVIAICVVTLAAGCHKNKRPNPVSIVNTADPLLAKQLVGGFYRIEAKSWRWTARQFIVSLLPPPGSENTGAKLSLHFFLPETQISQLGSMTLSAEIDDYPLPPETYSKSGDYFYIREIPAKLLKTNLVPVIFSFDKAKPPTGSDDRELGAVVSVISLEPH
jgi:hypothetical protein